MDTHSLVEEFMLLANVTVAQKIFESFPACEYLKEGDYNYAVYVSAFSCYFLYANDFQF